MQGIVRAIGIFGTAAMGDLTKTEQRNTATDASPAEAAEARASALIGALKAALDKVYGTSPEQELQRLIADYRKLNGLPPEGDGNPEGGKL